MSQQKQHTTLPWVCHSGMVWKDGPNVYPKGIEDGIPIARMDRDTEETTPTERDANAEFIVRACNNYDGLLELVESMKDILFVFKKWANFSRLGYGNTKDSIWYAVSEAIENAKRIIENCKGGA